MTENVLLRFNSKKPMCTQFGEKLMCLRKLNSVVHTHIEFNGIKDLLVGNYMYINQSL